MVALAFWLMASGLFFLPEPQQPNPASAVLQVRVYADPGVQTEVLDKASVVAKRLLQSAGLTMLWYHCDRPLPCHAAASPNMAEAIVHITTSRPDRRNTCGTAVRADDAPHGTVRVSIRCVERVALQIALTAGYGSSPLLSSPAYDDLVGAVIAHEIGHVLGLPHAESGLMRATLTPRDVVDLRQGELGFTEHEAALMQAKARSHLLRPIVQSATRRDAPPPENTGADRAPTAGGPAESGVAFH